MEPSRSRLGAVASKAFVHSDHIAMANTGKRLGASNFSQKEVDMMLNCIEDKLPIGSDEWENVDEMHNKTSGKTRTGDSIKKKFAKLKRIQVMH